MRAMLVQPARLRSQRGSSMIVVLIVLVIVTLLGIGGANLALLGEKSSRYERDQQVAFQSAEAALIEAADDIEGRSRGPGAQPRGALFKSDSLVDGIAGGTCGTAGNVRGICMPTPAAAKPLWASVDFLDDGSTAPTVEYGTYTGGALAHGTGVQPANAPRYVIEPLPWGQSGEDARIGYGGRKSRLFRVTAMGFGPREETQVVLQMEYIKAIEN